MFKSNPLAKRLRKERRRHKRIKHHADSRKLTAISLLQFSADQIKEFNDIKEEIEYFQKRLQNALNIPKHLLESPKEERNISNERESDEKGKHDLQDSNDRD